MRTRCIGSLVAVAVLLAGVGMVSAGVIRQDIEFDGHPVVLLLPENFDKGHDLIPLILHLHGALPFEEAPDRELEASGYRDLPSKYRAMVAAPRAALNPVLGLFAWDHFLSLVGCGPVNADDVGFLNRLLDELLAKYPIDPQRIYIYGYSSGASMAHVMACNLNRRTFSGRLCRRSYSCVVAEIILYSSRHSKAPQSRFALTGPVAVV